MRQRLLSLARQPLRFTFIPMLRASACVLVLAITTVAIIVAIALTPVATAVRSRAALFVQMAR